MRWLVGGTISVAACQVVLIVFGRSIFPPQPVVVEYVTVAPGEYRDAVEKRVKAESALMRSEGERIELKVEVAILREQVRRMHAAHGLPGQPAPSVIPYCEVEPGDLIPAQSLPVAPQEALP